MNSSEFLKILREERKNIEMSVHNLRKIANAFLLIGNERLHDELIDICECSTASIEKIDKGYRDYINSSFLESGKAIGETLSKILKSNS